MEIDDSKRKPERGSPLSSFSSGNCVRLIGTGAGDEQSLGHVYIVGASRRGRIATCLAGGEYRVTGLFVLEPNAKVVVE